MGTTKLKKYLKEQAVPIGVLVCMIAIGAVLTPTFYSAGVEYGGIAWNVCGNSIRRHRFEHRVCDGGFQRVLRLSFGQHEQSCDFKPWCITNVRISWNSERCHRGKAP